MADAIMHSNVKCSGLVVAEGKKGLIVGGVVEAYKGIKAKTIGSHMATLTELNVGVNLQIAEKYKELQDALAENKKDLTQAEQIIHILELKLKELGALPPDKADMLQKAYKTVEYLKVMAPTLEKKIEELAEKKAKKKTKNPEMNSGVMNMIGGFTVLRFTGMLGMRNVTFTKEELLKMNAQLNKIKKPKA